MRYALILAGGAGTRLWPMSREALPKQLIPFIGGRSLLQLSRDRIGNLVSDERCYVCAAEKHRSAVLTALPDLSPQQFFGEPEGRDTLNAVGFVTAVIARQDPEAVIAVFTADHLIEPTDLFQKTVERGFDVVERSPETLVTFGIVPTGPSTAYGYLELGEPLAENVFRVRQFREKPDAETARAYFGAGAERHLWNSGMFVWRASTLMDCIRRFEPSNFEGLLALADAWGGPHQEETLRGIYPTLKKISIDYSVMEPASRDAKVQVAAIPMVLEWLDVGSWPSFAQTCAQDDKGNTIAASKHLLLNTTNTLVVSNNPNHLIATIGCRDLIVIHTQDATLVCHADQAEAIKEVYRRIGERFGAGFL